MNEWINKINKGNRRADVGLIAIRRAWIFLYESVYDPLG